VDIVSEPDAMRIIREAMEKSNKQESTEDAGKSTGTALGLSLFAIAIGVRAIGVRSRLFWMALCWKAWSTARKMGL
jgi:hypothetical protein